MVKIINSFKEKIRFFNHHIIAHYDLNRVSYLESLAPQTGAILLDHQAIQKKIFYF